MARLRTPTVTNLVALSSDKPSVATVDMSGNITAVAAGTANITATLFGVITTMADLPFVQTLSTEPLPSRPAGRKMRMSTSSEKANTSS